MIEIDDLLAPLRQQLARYSLIESLYVIFAHMQYLQFGQPLPSSIEMDPAVASKAGYERGIFEWELDLLARELLHHAPTIGIFSLTRWVEFAKTLNTLKSLDDDITKRSGNLMKENILLELSRIAYREFPWQENPSEWRLARYYKIFSAPAVDTIIRAEIGLSADELYLLGLTMTGHFLTNFSHQHPIRSTGIGVADEKCRLFVQRFSKPLSTLSSMAAQSEYRDENFNYATNPLRIFPLIHVGLAGKHHIIAPIPTYLFHRFSAGLYYELIGNPDFGNAFGDSFQCYVGEVLNTALPASEFSVAPEEEYYVGSNRKDTIDWIASDVSGHLFVECKAKRMRLSSQIALADTKSLNADLTKISEFVVQTYKTIDDAKLNLYPHWQPDARPIYPIVVLLEEWYLFDYRLGESLDKMISDGLTAIGIDPNVMTNQPYSVCSVRDFEILTQVVATAGISSVLQKKQVSGKTKWNMHSFLLDEFGKEVKKIDRNGLFRGALNSVHPAIRNLGA